MRQRAFQHRRRRCCSCHALRNTNAAPKAQDTSRPTTARIISVKYSFLLPRAPPPLLLFASYPRRNTPAPSLPVSLHPVSEEPSSP